MKSKLIYFFFIFLIIGCGKKTDPIPKSQFIPPEEDKFLIEVVNNGIVITNNDKKYNLVVYKSSCENCGNAYKRITIVAPEESFTDKDVREETSYFYKFMFKHPEYNIFSEPVINRVTYNKQISVKNLKIAPMGTNKIKTNIAFTGTLHHYELYLNNDLYYKGRNSEIEINIIDGINNISILPFDVYNNKGVLFTKKIDSYQLIKPTPVNDLNYVISDNHLYISWNPSEHANKYKIRIIAKSNIMEYQTNLNYYRTTFPEKIKCIDIEVTAINDYMMSESSTIRACKNK